MKASFSTNITLQNRSKFRTLCLSSAFGNKNKSWPMLKWSYGIFIKTKYRKKKVKFLTKLGWLYNVSTALGSSSADYILFYYLAKGWRVNELNVRQFS